jgi:hypothetical protein
MILGIFTEGLANRRNIHSQVDFLDEGVRPDLFQQFFFYEHAPGVAHQTKKSVERLGGEVHRRSFTRQHAFSRVEYKMAERVDLLIHERHWSFQNFLKEIPNAAQRHSGSFPFR